MKAKTTPAAKVDQVLQEIAREKLGLDTLEEQKSDRLDFHEHAVWSIEAALRAAYEAGQASGG
jgi:hypothetical protein